MTMEMEKMTSVDNNGDSGDGVDGGGWWRQ